MNRLIDSARRVRPLFLIWCIVLLVALPIIAQGATTLLSDDFEDGNANGWSPSGGSWSVVTDGSRVYRQGSTSADAKSFVGSTSWTNQAVEAKVKPLAFNGTNRTAGVLARVQNPTNYYFLVLNNSNRVELGRRVSGTNSTLASSAFTVAAGTVYTLRLEANGTTLRGFVNGAQLLSASATNFSAGRGGLVGAFASAEFDDVLITSPDTLPTPTPVTPTRTPTPGTPTRTPTPGTPTATPPVGTDPGLVGFAAVNALGQNGTTGGSGGQTLTVSTANDFLAAIARPEPLVIRVSGMLTLPGPMHDVASNKTIIGIGSTAGLTGGGLNIGLPIEDAITSPPANAIRNVIVRNLTITNCPDDCINVQMFSHHVWLDHNDISRQNDGALDIKRGSDFVTVSWNHFHDSDKNMLLGHDDSNGAQDIGRLRVTYHHNFFDGSIQRNPRVRFGEPVHVFNNYYLNITGYGVASQMNAGVLVENNFFDNVEKPTRNDVGGDPGRIVARGNINVNTEDPIVTNGSVVEPRTFYNYTPDNAADIPSIVSNGAGVGRISG